MRRFEYFRPHTLDEAFALQGKFPDSRFIAGGTDLVVQIKNRELQPSALISLRSIPGLSGVAGDGVARIGALTTITDLMNHPALQRTFPVLMDAARNLACVQIRNVATIGGNLCRCSPCADTAPPLLVLDAKVRFRNAGEDREIPIHDFFMGPGETCLAPNEILTEILLEAPAENARMLFLKKGRVKMDLAIASVAVLLEMDGERCRKARIAAGSVAPVPMRLPGVEALLESTVVTRELLAEIRHLAAESVSPIDDIRSTGAYRSEIVGVFVKRAIEQLMGWSPV